MVSGVEKEVLQPQLAQSGRGWVAVQRRGVSVFLVIVPLRLLLYSVLSSVS